MGSCDEFEAGKFFLCTETSPRCFVIQQVNDVNNAMKEVAEANNGTCSADKNQPQTSTIANDDDLPYLPVLPWWFTPECRQQLLSIPPPATHFSDGYDPIGTPDRPPSSIGGDHQLSSAEQLKVRLKRQLEYYFSRENLINDRFLRSQMDPDQYVPIKILANFPKVAQLTNELELITVVLKSSNKVQVDDRGEKVRAVTKRCTIILREIPENANEEEVKGMFDGCPPFKSLTYGLNDSWYVTFETEDDTRKAFLHLQSIGKTFNGKPVYARIKTGGAPIGADIHSEHKYCPGLRGQITIHHEVFSSSAVAAIPPLYQGPLQSSSSTAPTPFVDGGAGGQQHASPIAATTINCSTNLGQILAQLGYVPRATFRPNIPMAPPPSQFLTLSQQQQQQHSMFPSPPTSYFTQPILSTMNSYASLIENGTTAGEFSNSSRFDTSSSSTTKTFPNIGKQRITDIPRINKNDRRSQLYYPGSLSAAPFLPNRSFHHRHQFQNFANSHNSIEIEDGPQPQPPLSLLNGAIGGTELINGGRNDVRNNNSKTNNNNQFYYGSQKQHPLQKHARVATPINDELLHVPLNSRKQQQLRFSVRPPRGKRSNIISTYRPLLEKENQLRRSTITGANCCSSLLEWEYGPRNKKFITATTKLSSPISTQNNNNSYYYSSGGTSHYYSNSNNNNIYNINSINRNNNNIDDTSGNNMQTTSSSSSTAPTNVMASSFSPKQQQQKQFSATAVLPAATATFGCGSSPLQSLSAAIAAAAPSGGRGAGGGGLIATTTPIATTAKKPPPPTPLISYLNNSQKFEKFVPLSPSATSTINDHNHHPNNYNQQQQSRNNNNMPSSSLLRPTPLLQNGGGNHLQQFSSSPLINSVVGGGGGGGRSSSSSSSFALVAHHPHHQQQQQQQQELQSSSGNSYNNNSNINNNINALRRPVSATGSISGGGGGGSINRRGKKDHGKNNNNNNHESEKRGEKNKIFLSKNTATASIPTTTVAEYNFTENEFPSLSDGISNNNNNQNSINNNSNTNGNNSQNNNCNSSQQNGKGKKIPSLFERASNDDSSQNGVGDSSSTMMKLMMTDGNLSFSSPPPLPPPITTARSRTPFSAIVSGGRRATIAISVSSSKYGGGTRNAASLAVAAGTAATGMSYADSLKTAADTTKNALQKRDSRASICEK